VADGTWRLKRGVDPALVEQVKTQLKAPLLASPFVEAPEVTPVTPAEVVTPPVTPPPATLPAEAPVNTYPDLSNLITVQVKAGNLLPTDIPNACEASGATAAIGALNLPDLVKAEALPYLPLVAEQLRIIWATRA
jgi:hypothetical protein